MGGVALLYPPVTMGGPGVVPEIPDPKPWGINLILRVFPKPVGY